MKGFFTAVTLFFLAASFVFGEDVKASIREYSGDVQVKAPGGEWVPAQTGMSLDSSSMISTGFRSTAFLVLGNSTIVVRPLTRLSLEELASLGNDEKIALNLRVGRVRATVLPPDLGSIEFEVISPMVTASVRGTVFEFDTVNLTVQSGTVAFTGNDRVTVFATAGKSALLDRTGGSTAPLRREEQELAELKAGTSQGIAASPPASGPVSPVVAYPGGLISVPGLAGGPGGGISGGGEDADLGLGWW
jgi:hypothetical protein